MLNSLFTTFNKLTHFTCSHVPIKGETGRYPLFPIFSLGNNLLKFQNDNKSAMSTIALLLYKREERNVYKMSRKKRPKQEVGERNDSSNKGGGISNLEFENGENKFNY